MSEKKNHPSWTRILWLNFPVCGLLRFHDRLLVSSSLRLELMVRVDHEVATNTEIRKVLSQNTCFCSNLLTLISAASVACKSSLSAIRVSPGQPLFSVFSPELVDLPLFFRFHRNVLNQCSEGIDGPTNFLLKRVSTAVLLSAILWWLCNHPQHSIAESHHTSGTPLFSSAIAVPSFTLWKALSATPFVSERGRVLVSCFIVSIDQLFNIFHIVIVHSFWLSRRDKKSW